MVEGIDPDMLTEEDIKQVMEVLNLINENRGVRIRGRTYSNGSRHIFLRNINK